jgi:hypothetical protein
MRNYGVFCRSTPLAGRKLASRTFIDDGAGETIVKPGAEGLGKKTSL